MRISYTLPISIAVVSLLLNYQFLLAAWTSPSGLPPNNNTPAPVNVGNTAQVKTGNFTADILTADTEMRSARYCNKAGTNCFTPNDVLSCRTAAYSQTQSVQMTASWGGPEDCGYGDYPCFARYCDRRYGADASAQYHASCLQTGGSWMCVFACNVPRTITVCI